ncbi:LuxR C-terminal-related transcriptional regulator [Microbacterium aurugineum]|uniref:LuxR C-terminal-related transcriptional regulator n=1 Tax=Microbacterium aurugineum TaxID=2851642 RepID=UPI0035576B1D
MCAHDLIARVRLAADARVSRFCPPHLCWRRHPSATHGSVNQHDPRGIADSAPPRQLQVLTHAAQGATNQDIAEALVISVGTVKRHLHDVYSALQVSTRLEAVRACGLLSPPHQHSRLVLERSHPRRVS